MAVAVRSYATYAPGSTGYGSGTRSVAVPTGTASGDLLVAIVMQAQEATAAPTAPSGWTQTGAIAPQAGSARAGANGASAVFWKVATASEAAYSFVCGATSTIIVFALTGADTSAPIYTAPSWATGTTTAVVAPSVSGVVDGLLLTAHAVLYGSGAVTFSTPTSMTSQGGQLRSGNYISSATFSQVLTSTAATGTKTSTASTAGTPNTEAVALVVKPYVAPVVTQPTSTQYNKCPNPACGASVSGWAGPISQVTGLTGAPRTTGCSIAVDAAAGSYLGTPTVTTGAANETWSAVMYLRSSVTRTYQFELNDFSTGTNYGTKSVSLSAGVWTAVNVVGTFPNAGRNIYMICETVTSGTAATLTATAVRMAQVNDASLSFFDGDSSGATWDGTRYSSTSTMAAAGSGPPGDFFPFFRGF